MAAIIYLVDIYIYTIIVFVQETNIISNAHIYLVLMQLTSAVVNVARSCLFYYYYNKMVHFV